MNSSAAAFSSPIVDGIGPIVSDTTALVFISGGNKTPVDPLRLELREAGGGSGSTGNLTSVPLTLPASRFPLFYIPAEVKLAAGEGDDAVETCLHLRGKIAPRHQALGLRTNRFLCLHEVSLFQFAGVVVCHKGLDRGIGYRCQADVS